MSWAWSSRPRPAIQTRPTPSPTMRSRRTSATPKPTPPPGTPATTSAPLSPFWNWLPLARLCLGFAFFDQHHRDAVDDRVEHLAVRAAQLVGLLELHLRVAFRAGQDFEQFLRDHPRMVVRFRL